MQAGLNIPPNISGMKLNVHPQYFDGRRDRRSTD